MTDGSLPPSGAGPIPTPSHAFLLPDSRANLETGPHRRHGGAFYRMCRTAAQAQKKPIRAGPSPAGLEQQRHGGRRERGSVGRRPRHRGRARTIFHMTQHDGLGPLRTWSWFVQQRVKACYE